MPRPRPAGVLRTSRRPSATPVPATPSPSPAPNAHFLCVLTLSDDCLPTPSAGGCRFTTPRLASQSAIAGQLIGAALEQCSCRPLPRRSDPWWLRLGHRAALHGSLERLAETNAHRRVAPVDRRQPCARIHTIATAFRTSSIFLPTSRDSSWPATPHHLLCTTSPTTTSVHPVEPAERPEGEKSHQLPVVRARRQ